MPSQIIGVAGVDLLFRNPSRLSLTLRNESAGGQIMYAILRDAKGLTIAEADYVLRPTEEKNFTYVTDGEDIRNPVSVISDVAGAVLYFAETSSHGGE